jgi:6-pyruvoyltetrahydropterin/6-carboxytetrahydropterin synthase
MFEVTVEDTFAAGHALRGYRGKCENLHGHNYRVRITLRGPQLDAIGLLYDFKELKRIVAEIAERLDHHYLNELPPFDKLNPSAENMAKYFYEESVRRLGELQPENGARVASVTISETDTTTATYTGE